MDIILNSFQQRNYDYFIKNYESVINQEINLQPPKLYEYLIKNGYQNLVYTGNSDFFRGLGKTFLCLYIANEFKWDIITFSNRNVYALKLCEKYGFTGFNIISYGSNSRGIKTTETVILDEIFMKDIEAIKDRYMFKNVIGFVR